MTDLGLNIIHVQQDPLAAQRMSSGKFRINHELNQEWIDIRNDGPYVLNMQGRVLACMKRNGPRNAPSGFQRLRYALLRANTTLPLHPGEKIRIYTGEQPRQATKVDARDRLDRVLWAVQTNYLWVPAGNEAHIYFSRQDLKYNKAPLSRYIMS